MMKKIIFFALPLVIFSNFSYSESLCNLDEKKLFECQFEKSIKSVSLCQSKSNPKNIFYRFGTPQKVELTLPKENSKPTYLEFEQFGPSASQWMKAINFPIGNLEYSLATPQGISVQLSVSGLKNPFSMSCDLGDSGSELSDAYDLMKKLKFREKR